MIPKQYGFDKKTRLVFCCFAALNVVGCSNWTNDNLVASKSKGSQLIKAIGEYQDSNNELPRSLADLPPKFIASIPMPDAGTKNWKYKVRADGNGFTLTFETSNGYPACYYDSEVGRWIEDR